MLVSLLRLSSIISCTLTTVPTDTNKRKKRRLDASPAPSDVSSARASPAPPGGPPTPSLEKVSRSLSRSLSINTAGQGTSSPGPEPTPSTATTSAATPSTARSVGKQQQQQATQLTRKERKEAIVAQLPLKEGRPVAFKPSAKAAGKGAKTEDGDLAYFLTRVVRCIAGDKNRYEVQDVQDEHEVDGKPGAYVGLVVSCTPLHCFAKNSTDVVIATCIQIV